MKPKAEHIALAALLPHLLCCGLPALLALLGVAANAGLVVGQVGWLHEVMHGYEFPLLGFGAAMLLVALAANLYAMRTDCHVDGDCHHPPCTPQKTVAWRWFFISLALHLVAWGGVLAERF